MSDDDTLVTELESLNRELDIRALNSLILDLNIMLVDDEESLDAIIGDVYWLWRVMETGFHSKGISDDVGLKRQYAEFAKSLEKCRKQPNVPDVESAIKSGSTLLSGLKAELVHQTDNYRESIATKIVVLKMSRSFIKKCTNTASEVEGHNAFIEFLKTEGERTETERFSVGKWADLKELRGDVESWLDEFDSYDSEAHRELDEALSKLDVQERATALLRKMLTAGSLKMVELEKGDNFTTLCENLPKESKKHLGLSVVPEITN